MNKEKSKTKNYHVGAGPVSAHHRGMTRTNVGADDPVCPNHGGITLIALVITIIVLLILAGVAINLAIDSDGLFAQANQAGKEWNEAVANEDAELGSLIQTLNSIDENGTSGGDGGEEEPETPTTVAVESVSINSTSPTIKVGETVKLTATINPSNATNQNISWTSSSEIATVDANGTVTGISAGTAIITVTTESRKQNSNM